MKGFYKVNVNKDTVISISNGNNKIGRIKTLNLLPGDKPLANKTKGLLTNIKGTCSGCCSGCKSACYAIKGALFHSNTIIPSNGKNTLFSRKYPELYFKQIKEYVSNPRRKIIAFRYHSSGEIETYAYLLNMAKVAKDVPNVKFYFYTKRFAFIKRYLKEEGAFPENLICNISVWHKNHIKYRLDGLNQFIYDDGNEPELANVAHCPAISKPAKPGGRGKETGVTCDKCGLCWRKNDGHKVAVYNH